MILKDKLILTILSLGLGWVVVTTATTPIQIQSIKDTIVVDTPLTFSVKDKTALFIGDSHTCNHTNGWQKVLSTKVGFNMINASVVGKTTYWMLDQAHLRLNNKIDYCFIYGGANDMYTNSITPEEAVDNIKGIARMCNGLGIKCIVITGFDAVKCTKTPNKLYTSKYTEFQQLLLTKHIDFAQVIDTRIIVKTDCWDNLCHMNPTGHKKIANKIIKDLNLRVF
jgi:lysophospholipase L1-like esterase